MVMVGGVPMLLVLSPVLIFGFGPVRRWALPALAWRWPVIT